MAELTTLARPYAKAVFEYARETQQLGIWSESLTLVATIAQEENVAKLFDSPTLTAEQKASALMNLCGDQPNDKLGAFITVLAANKRLALLASIRKLFEILKAEQEKFSEVQIVSALPLDTHVEKALAENLKTILSSDVSLQTKIDPNLIGGVLVRAGDTVIDASVKGRLNKLVENLDV